MKRFEVRYSRLLILITTLLILNGCYEEQIIESIDGESKGVKILRINQIDGFVDIEDQLIFFTLGADTIQSFSSSIHFYDYESMQMDGKDLINDQVNELGDITVNYPYEIIAKNALKIDTFRLVFTRLPLIHITTSDKIVDDPKVLSNISIQYCDENKDSRITYLFNSYAGIEYRGASSLRYDKKSYGIELWKNKYEDDYISPLLGMRPGEDWILDAMYIDDLRMRNKISFELWEKMSALHNDSLYTVYPGIQCKFVELLINNNYVGLYSLNEKLDEKLLRFSDYQYVQGGVMYKAVDWGDGATTFDIYSSDPQNAFYWDGWELIYPEHDTAWTPLMKLRKLIVFSNDQDFNERIESTIDLGNAIDYYLYINLMLAYDNRGKNTYLARYSEQSPLFIIPWDLEATWGINWDRSRNNSNGMMNNHLYERLIETNTGDFNNKIKEKWLEYRSNILSEEALLQPINEYYHLMKNNGVIDRENSRWDNVNIDLDGEYIFITEWIIERLEYLDNYFE